MNQYGPALLTVAFLCLASASPAHASDAKDNPGKILIVVTNHQELGDTGKETGYFLSEVAHPWVVFREAGYVVDFASPRGGFAPMDPKSFDLSDHKNKRFWHTLEAVQGVTNTRALAEVKPANYEAIFYAGGHGTMWDFADNEAVKRKTAAIYEQGGVVGAVCHGPAALIDVTLADGQPLLAGRRVTGFTNKEEEAVKLTDEMPFLLETRLRQRGASFSGAANFQKNVVVDDRVVTGQNPASATAAARAIVDRLEAPASN